MKKTKTIEYYICDFDHGVETEARFKIEPSGKDACERHYHAFLKEARLPNGEMSGFKAPVEPGYEAVMTLEYKKKRKNK
jgi:hypothetical protein